MSHPTTLPGLGTLLQLKISGTFTTIGQRVSIEGPGSELGTRDVTHLDSTVKSVRPTLPDLGKVTIKLFFDPSDPTHSTARGKVYTPPSSPDEFQLIYNDGLNTHATDAFDGYITKWEPNGIEVEETLGADVEITLTDTFVSTTGS